MTEPTTSPVISVVPGPPIWRATCSTHGVLAIAGDPFYAALAAIGHGTVAHPRLGAGP